MRKILVFTMLSCMLKAQTVYDLRETFKKNNLNLDIKVSRLISDNRYTLKNQPAIIKVTAIVSKEKKICAQINKEVLFYLKSSNPSIMSTQWEIQEKYLLMHVKKMLLSSKKYCV